MVFIDESGTTSKTDDRFTTAAVWCAPKIKEGYQSVLKPTAKCVWESIGRLTGKKPSEIHYASGLRRYADELISTISTECYQDCSIINAEKPWVGQPIAYTVSVFHPNIEALITNDRNSFDSVLRSRAIISLLRPLFLHQGRTNLEVSVILDADIWKKTAQLCSSNCKEILNKKRH